MFCISPCDSSFVSVNSVTTRCCGFSEPKRRKSRSSGRAARDHQDDKLELLHLERGLQRIPSPTSHAKPHTIAKDDEPTPIRLAVQLAHTLEVHDQRTMNAN